MMISPNGSRHFGNGPVLFAEQIINYLHLFPVSPFSFSFSTVAFNYIFPHLPFRLFWKGHSIPFFLFLLFFLLSLFPTPPGEQTQCM